MKYENIGKLIDQLSGSFSEQGSATSFPTRRDIYTFFEQLLLDLSRGSHAGTNRNIPCQLH